MEIKVIRYENRIIKRIFNLVLLLWNILQYISGKK